LAELAQLAAGATISSAMPETKADSKTIRAKLARLQGNGVSWVIVRVPFSVEKRWKTRGNLRVHIEVNGFQYRTALLPTRSGQHFFIVNKKMQKAARIGPGNIASFILTPDFSPRVTHLPKELEAALNEDRTLRKWFEKKLSYSIRKWFVDQVANAKSPQTRLKRAERLAERLLETMEAEYDLPPMMRLAFARHPGSEQAWLKKTETQRRLDLLAVFHYRTPESRLNRLERVISSLSESDTYGDSA
jgi:uncharacterized protein YdeI (YjbR/CyaY-like superfamily)